MRNLRAGFAVGWLKLVLLRIPLRPQALPKLLAAKNARQVTRRPRTSPAPTCCAACCSAASATAACKAAGTTTRPTTGAPTPLNSGADPAVVGQWITETQARKLAADARLRAATGSTRPGPAKMTKEQIAATVNAIRDLMQAFRYATTEDKAEIYAGLNLQLTYNPGGRMANVRAEIGQTCTKGPCPRTEAYQLRMLMLLP